jgi:hypothetical protein
MFEVVESYLKSKSGDDTGGEDRIFSGKYFSAVVDGSTSHAESCFKEGTQGGVGANLVIEALALVSSDATAYDCVAFISNHIKSFYERNSYYHLLKKTPSLRATASAAILSHSRHEIWIVGDCQALINGQHSITNRKKIDIVAAEARSALLTSFISSGESQEKLIENDLGRLFINPLINAQSIFQNSDIKSEYGYSVLDGFPVEKNRILITKLDTNATDIILATDGYPLLRETLHLTEKILNEIILDDPLLIRKFKQTKGCSMLGSSYDDRAFLRIISTKKMLDSKQG